MEEYGELREPGFTDMEVAFRIIFYLSQNEVIEVKNSNHDLDDPNKDHNDLINAFVYEVTAFKMSDSSTSNVHASIFV